MSQENPRVAFQGAPGAFSGAAAKRLLGPDVDLVPRETFDEMFAAVDQGLVDYCLAPIENSLFGSVHQNYDLLLSHDLRIVGEVNLRIVHNLIAPPGIVLSDVKRVYSHPVALGQCRQFLSRHPEMEPLAAYDTAGAVKLIMESREPGAAAIASAEAAEVYKASVLATEIEDDRQNYTRFLLLSKSAMAGELPASADKTSIVFSLENHTGSLYRAMAVFALRDIDLTKIESRPLVGRPWEYSFYVDFIGHATDTRVRNALAHLEVFASSVRVLGCYPRASREAGE